jgi:beta-galactosidase GanA
MLVSIIAATAAAGSFKVSGTKFLLDDKPFQYVSGSFHYFRQHPDYWEDTIKKMANGGLNVVQTYVPWNLHEPKKGQFNFQGFADIEHWVELCQKCNMYVILRPGPYICAEWDFGGLPYWLITDGVKILRSTDELYIQHVDDFLTVLFTKLKRFMYHAGGPIIMVQVENEYGAYFPCDHMYMRHLSDLTKQILGHETVLFTTDQPYDYVLECGTSPGDAVVTIDFGIG